MTTPFLILILTRRHPLPPHPLLSSAAASHPLPKPPAPALFSPYPELPTLPKSSPISLDLVSSFLFQLSSLFRHVWRLQVPEASLVEPPPA
jgi:hypothetical protein